MGYEISTRQLQFDAADNETNQTSIACYNLEGTVLQSVDKYKYKVVTIIEDLRWNTHLSNICTKANRTLGLLRQKLYSLSPRRKGSSL